MGVNGYVTLETQEATDRRNLESCFADQDVDRLEGQPHHEEGVRRRWMIGGDDLRAQRRVGLPLDVRTHQPANIEVRGTSSQTVEEPGCRWRTSHTLLPPDVRAFGGFALSCCPFIVSSGSGLLDRT